MFLSTSRFLIMPLLAFSFSYACLGQSLGIDPIVLKSERIRQQIAPQGNQQPVLLTGLTPGATYHLVVPGSTEFPDCPPTMTLTTGQSAVAELIFVATGPEMSVQFEYPCAWNSGAMHYVSLACTSCAIPTAPDAPDLVLEVSNLGYEEAVRDVLIGGNCFDVSGIAYCGSSSQVGTFSSGLTNVGFSTGVILATGPISIAPGPNNANGAGGTGGGCSSDSDLALLATSDLNDVAKIEFDFTPTKPVVTFEYVFASEEYCEFVDSEFNDVFGFFISGPGITGTQNIAIVPGSPAPGIPVAINNVNHTSFQGFYVNNQPASSGNLCGQTASTLPSTSELQYDGYTRKFTAVANVIPCQTYHIKLAIADVGDSQYDSAVFLKEGSFSAGSNASVQWVVNGQENAEETYESCGLVQLLFDRVGGNTSLPVTVSFTVTGTATSGLDYAPIPTTITIPAGQSTFSLPVNILNDLIMEGQESIVITLNNLCSCSMPQTTLLINDLPQMTTIPDTVYVCGTGFALLDATVEGGISPYTYNWSNNGGTQSSAGYFVTAHTNYRVTITDFCGQTIVQTIHAHVNPLPRAQLMSPAPQLCPNGGSGILNINFIGAGPFTLTYTINDVEQPTLYDITDNPYQLIVTQPGLYRVVSVIDGGGCIGLGIGIQLVTQSQLALTATVANNLCSGQQIGAINTTITGGQTPFSYVWSGPQAIPNNTADPTNLAAGTYTLTLTDAVGCTQIGNYTVQASNLIETSVFQVNSPSCGNPNGGSVNLEVTGGTPGYSYLWNNGSTVQDPSNLTTGTYTTTVTDMAGCTATATIAVTSNSMPPTAVSAVQGALDCQTLSVPLIGQGSSVGTEYTYLWTPPTGVILAGPATSLTSAANTAGIYQLMVTNTTNGCVSTSTVTVPNNAQNPVADAGSTLALTCAVTNVTLNGTGSSAGNNNFSYFWTASNGGVIAGGDNTTQPIVSATGTYTIVVTNLSNHCTSSDTVEVTANTTPPVAAIAPAGEINCTQTTVILNSNGSSPANVLYSWNSLNGNIIAGGDTANPIVTEAGDYTVVVTNPANGCTDDATVLVTVNQTVPTAIVIANGELNCNTSQLTINGTNSSPTSQFAWTATQGGQFVSGQNTLTPVINKPGIYTLQITNPANNCSASASVQITQNITPPVAEPGNPGILNCYNPTQIVGNPNAFLLPGMFYQWSFTGGGNIVGATNLPSATVTTPATYNLLVTNQLNGCTNTASVIIGQNNTPPVAVVAPAGQINCTTPFIQLNGSGTSAGPSFTYQWTGPSGILSTGGTTLNPVVTSDGTYTLVVTNNTNGCTDSETATVTANLDLPDVTIAPASPITCSILTIPLNAVGTSSGANFAYQWGTIDGQINSGANSLTPVAGKPGTYTLIVTNTTNNCTATENVVVPANNVLPTINPGPNQLLNCTQPELTINATGSTGPEYTYQWTAPSGVMILAGANSLTPVVNAPATYSILVTNTTTGCTQTASILVSQDAGEPVILMAEPAPLTCDIEQITINAAGSSTGGGFTPEWFGPGILSGQNSLAPLVDMPGVYTLVITNTDNGCVTTSTITVPENKQAPIADAGIDQTLNCFHPQVQLSGSDMSTGTNFVYNWAGPGIISGGTNPNPVINLPGLYSVTVTNTENGCSHTDVVNLDANFNTPVVDAGPGDTLSCVDNFYQTLPIVSGSGTFTYAWSTTGGSFLTPSTEQAPILNGVGFYYLTVTNTVTGCTASDNLQVTKSSDFPTANAGFAAALNCTVTELVLDGTGSSQNGPYEYLWIPTVGGNIVAFGNTLNPVINEPGTYSLSVRDTSNSCISYSEVIIGEDVTHPAIEAGPPVTLTCSTPSLVLAGSVNTNGNFSYAWSASNGGNIVTNEETLSPQVNAVGIYTLVVTNLLNGCTSTDQVAVLADQNAPVVSIATPDTLNCLFNTITLNANITSGGSLSYIWNTSNGTFTDLSNPLHPKVNAPGTYQLIVTNADNNCTSLAAVFVPQDIVKPLARAGADQEINCANVITTLDGVQSSSNGNYFYQWTTPNGVILAGANTLSPAVSDNGTYLLTVLNTDNGCSSSDLVIVNEDIAQPTIAIITPAVISCFASEVTLDASNSSTGPDFEYSWSTQDGNILTGENQAQALVDAPGSYIFTVLNNDNGCSNSSITPVVENTVTPSVQILPPAILTCSVDEVIVTALAESTSQYVFGWSTTNGHIVSGSTTLNLRVDEPGNYNIIVINNLNGCIAFSGTTVQEVTNHPEDFDYSFNLPGCRDNDGSVQFDTVIGGIPPYLYSLDGGDHFYTSVSYSGLPPGVYELMVQDANGCVYAQDLELTQAIDPGITISPQFSLSFGDSLQLNAELPTGFDYNLIDTIIWTPLDYLQFAGNTIDDLLSPMCKPFHTVRYEVKIITKNGGCEAVDRVLISVDTEPIIYIPNAFQPDDPTSTNHLAMIFASDTLKQIKEINTFQIYDRWGDRVHHAEHFQANDPAHGWNGRIGGTGPILTPAVFVFFARVELINGRIIQYEGDITLIR